MKDNKTNYFIDVHALQAVPANNLNRDDTNSPKTMTFGGARRARVSSQAWKKATRDYFRDTLGMDTGIRTKNVHQLIIDEVKSRGIEGMDDDKLNEFANTAMDLAGLVHKPNKKTGVEETSALYFIGRQQVKNLVDLMLNNEINDDDRLALVKEARKALKDNNPVDVALFGKMVADTVELNVDAAAQVAHAMGVTKVTPEFDYFTAVDDYSMADHAGGAMLGTIEYNSSVLYRYADISLSQLEQNLGDDPEVISNAVMDFITAFIESMPTGKQNTFAAQTLPDAVVVTIRAGRPVSYADAFLNPINGEDVMNKAIDRMVSYATGLNEAYDLDNELSMVVSVQDGALDELGEQLSLPMLVAKVGDKVTELVYDDAE